ncbi:hypothetical protein NIES4071_104140 (plasmid) [Calothrix sp. NIES-4071]|nr:hypothetical protein NIES4071_104140 [Calothrix sp. NIES-4071]BAZ64401.1 hypothetical protein NIES4105_101340 [Calothrix sp. NIES-4105]
MNQEPSLSPTDAVLGGNNTKMDNSQQIKLLLEIYKELKKDPGLSNEMFNFGLRVGFKYAIDQLEKHHYTYSSICH